MSIPLCCPAVSGDPSAACPRSTAASREVEDCDQQQSMQHKLEHKASYVKKPLSEWTKLNDKQCTAKNVWVPLSNKKEVSACNPRQLQDLQSMRDRIESRARQQGPALSWTEFNGGPLDSYNDAQQLAAQQANANRWVKLTQADFASGTVRLRAGGYYQLDEDIEFDPNAAVGDWLERRAPTAAQRAAGALYSSNAYVRGFFAALTIESSDVYLDLNGHTFAHSHLSTVRQRFQAVIELADQPFVPAQGPGNFGADIDAAINCVVANGTIGLTSHHGIHGNACQNVLLENLTFKDYDVAAISVNGVKNFVISGCTLTGTFQNVLFNAKLSAALFGLSDARALLQVSTDAGTGASQEHASLMSAVAALESVIEPMVVNGTVNPSSPFANKSCSIAGETVKVIDGNAYGILFNSFGVAVNAFDQEAGTSDGSRPDSERVLICNTTVDKTYANVDEIPTLFDTREGQGPIVDTSGAVLDLSQYFDCQQQQYDLTGTDNAEQLVLLQLAVVQLRDKIAADFPQTDLALWAVGRVPSELYSPLLGNNVLSCENVPTFLVWKRNGDSMFHVNKGVFGLRLDGITQLCVRDTKVTNSVNCGHRGIFCALPCEDLVAEESPCTLLELDLPSNCCPLNMSGDFPAEYAKLARAAYKDASDGGHPLQAAQLGYCGADTYGAALSAVSHFDLSSLQIESTDSHHGSAFGLVNQYESNNGKITCTSIDGVHAASEACEVDFSQGAKTPVSQGVRIDTSSTKITLHKPSIADVTAVGCAACRLCVNSAEVAIAL